MDDLRMILVVKNVRPFLRYGLILLYAKKIIRKRARFALKGKR